MSTTELVNHDAARNGTSPASGSTSPLGRFSEPAVYLGIVLIGFVAWSLLVGTNAFYSDVLVSVFCWAIAVTGLNVIGGLGGYPSLVQGAFYGIGAYVSTVLLSHGQGFWLSAAVSVGAALLAGLVVGVFFTRTRGQYFAIGTLFFGAVLSLVLNNWTARTGGPNGLPVDLGLQSLDQVYLLIAAALVLSMAGFRCLSRRRLGRRLLAIREDEDLAEHVGVPTTLVKLLAFVISAGVGGAAGVVFAQYNGSVSPGLFTYYVGFLMFVSLSVGGAGRLLGPLLGSLFVEGFPQLINISNGLGQLVVGLVFVLVVIAVPEGFMGVVDRIGSALLPRLRRSSS